jgi:hypothetical protein
MTWERRSGTKARSYYYRGTRVEGRRVKKEYLGCSDDPITQILARADRLQQSTRIAAIEAAQAEIAQYREVDKACRELETELRLMITAAMLAAGFLRRGGRWMRRKQKGECMMPESDTAREARLPTREHFEHLVERARTGDREARQELRVTLESCPSLWQPAADLTRHVEDQLIEVISRESPLLAESLRLSTTAMRKELAWDTATPLERLVIDQAVISLLELQHHQMATSLSRVRRQDAQFWDQRRDRAQQRHLAALKTLAEIRNLAPDTHSAATTSEQTNCD